MNIIVDYQSLTYITFSGGTDSLITGPRTQISTLGYITLKSRPEELREQPLTSPEECPEYQCEETENLKLRIIKDK